MEELLFDITRDDDIYTEIVKKHMHDRRIIINGEISDSIFEEVCLMILKWNQEDKDLPVESRKKIYVYINTVGGEANLGMNILNVIKTSITPVVTVGFSKCYSMGCYILAAGHERYAFPYTTVLYHDGQSACAASGNKARDIQKFHDAVDKRLDEFLVQNTNMDADFLEEIKDREYYMFADEAKERGFIDKIIGVDCTMDEVL